MRFPRLLAGKRILQGSNKKRDVTLVEPFWVFFEIPDDDARRLLHRYGLGDTSSPIRGGPDNLQGRMHHAITASTLEGVEPGWASRTGNRHVHRLQHEFALFKQTTTCCAVRLSKGRDLRKGDERNNYQQGVSHVVLPTRRAASICPLRSTAGKKCLGPADRNRAASRA